MTHNFFDRQRTKKVIEAINGLSIAEAERTLEYAAAALKDYKQSSQLALAAFQIDELVSTQEISG